MPINSRIYCFVSFKYNHEGASNGVWTNSKIKIRTSSKMSALINMHETLQIYTVQSWLFAFKVLSKMKHVLQLDDCIQKIFNVNHCLFV